ncbi:MarR family winged helix-turn-helix transcriptional regulator [Streptoalloteichus tenebrarius]|uniref:MarR family winged helix-turn-helix transcriptional regulator n=1 Tax=Streptoalloteichus tenebrarius (strain ATCC 17920 / DSM 40477 / JCM 4838 / CBS 697.72 / NBRC 16177 / NCIMB 11028 / NRRL B-12390 / A12253. 1 / ISP 5477) TaxID=1933 RepID=UPI0020A4CC7C|nr:MarR family transcriptional regulator [Streptoalloteichus tenebrarius]
MSTSAHLPEDAERVYREYLSAVVLHGQAVAEAVGMHTTDAYALNVLGVHGALTAGELAERTGLTTGAVTRLIDRLERAGAVRRVRDPGDRRRVIIEAVPREDDPTEKLVAPARRRVAEVFEGYDEEQVRVLFDYFAKAAAALREATEEMRGTTRRRRTS